MDPTKFVPSVPAVAPIPPTGAWDYPAQIADLTAQLAEARAQLETNRAALVAAEHLAEGYAAAHTILRELAAAGVMEDGFMTNAVGHRLLVMAERARQFLKEHP